LRRVRGFCFWQREWNVGSQGVVLERGGRGATAREKGGDSEEEEGQMLLGGGGGISRTGQLWHLGMKKKNVSR